ncbi:MAG TPA: hypothetical protein DCY07_03030 [Rhodospirillaceae bacterium]|nr:hypothetical protein [Rhodospirillaceae bacterium]
MIVGRQIRAARALLDMSQDELAEAAGLTPQAIRKIEGGDVQPREGTIADITRAFNDRGLEFTENSGVRLKSDGVEIFEGPDRFDAFYDFLYEHLKTKGGEVCLSITDERLLSKYRKNPTVHYKRMQDLSDRGVIKKFRILATKSNFASDFPYNLYKWQPDTSLAPTAFYTFGDCLALISFVHTPAPYVVVLHSAPLADSYRQAFNIAWDAAKAPPQKDSKKGNTDDKF